MSKITRTEWKLFLREPVLVFWGIAFPAVLLTVMGLIPGLNTTFGLIPIHGNDVWLHALIAIAAAYFGFAPVRATDRDTAPATHDTAVTH